MARITVRLSDGRVGTIEENEYNPQAMVRLVTPQQASQPQKSVSQSVGEGAVGLFKGVLGGILNPVIDLANKGLSEQRKAVQNTKKGDILGALMNAAQATKNTFVSPESGKAAADVASFAVPFGKAPQGANLGISALTKFLAPGAAVGGLSGISKEDATPESVVGDTVLGAGGAGVLGALGKVINLTGKGTSKVLGKTGQALENQATKSTLKASPSAYKNAIEEHGLDINKIFDKHFKGKTDYDEILGGVKDRGSGGLLGGKIGNAEKVIDKEIKTAGSSIKFSPDELTNALKKEMNLLKKTVGNDEKIADIEQLIKDTAKRFKNGISAKQLLDLKRAADSRFGKAVTETEKGSVVTSTQKTIANTARSLLKSRFKNIAGALDEETELYTLKPILNSARAGGETGGKSPLGILDLLTATAGGATGGPLGALAGFGLKKAVDSPKIVGGLGNILSKASEAVPQAQGLNPMLTQILGQVSARGGNLQGVLPISSSTNSPDSNNNEYNNPQEGFHDTSISQDVNSEPDQAQIVKQALAIAMLQDLANGGKNITELKAISEVIDKLGPQAGKPLSGPNSVLLNKAKTAVSAVDRIESSLMSPDGKLQSGKLWAKKLNPLDQEGRQLGSDIVSAIDILGYFRTGAAITKEQRADYIYMFPNELDDAATVRRKIKNLQDEFEGYAQGISQSGGALDLSQIQATQ